MRRRWLWLVLGVSWAVPARGADRPADPILERQVRSLIKARCVKCHGPAKREGKLNLATPVGLARGGKNGAVVVPGDLDASPLWVRVDDEEMPPKEPLSGEEKALIRRWIERGAPGLGTAAPGSADHWAFDRPSSPNIPAVRDGRRCRTPIDRFIQAELEANGLSLGPEANRVTLLRRVSLDLTGLPPSPDEIRRFLDDPAPDAYERMVDRALASPHYGERLGKDWLDAAGYADSNGYFNADTDRPLAHRYRDYVIRSLNEDKPLDLFIREQLAGDELAGFRPGVTVTPEMVEKLTASHFLRNAPDGTGESDGNPDEVRADRYAVLEGANQVVGSALLGLTVQCARCHDHKFEPVTQKDYYQLYAIFWPAFDVDHWTKPQARVVESALPGELAAWEKRAARIDSEIASLRAEFAAWVRANRGKGTVRFRDDFDSDTPLAERWSPTAPGDDAPAGSVAVNVDSAKAPGAIVKDRSLRIIEGGGAGNRWLSTRQAFDWTPDAVGGWVQVTFDLVATGIEPGAKAAERIGYYIALNDFQDNGPGSGGNVLIDGNPAGGAAVHVDYPGADSQSRGVVGTSGYTAGRNFGVRVTNLGEGRFQLEQLVDWVPDEKAVTLTAQDLPDGGFGFEYCCGRSFLVDNVVVESGSDAPKAFEALRAKRQALDSAISAKNAERGERPGRIAWVADREGAPSPTYLLRRGLYTDPGETVDPGPPGFLADPDNPFDVRPPAEGRPSSGRRLALARWLTRPGSRPAALLARVHANRLWQHHFGKGLVATPENLGYSGTPPTHPALLEYLAAELARQGWRSKPLHRLILLSSVYRQSGTPSAEASQGDPDNGWCSSFPSRRLDAEAIRDAMLDVSGERDRRLYGPYVPSKRNENGEVVVDAGAEGFARRSVYLQQRRTQVLSLLEVFDAPSIVTTCTRRSASTIPLQSLGLLNSDFVIARARHFARRVERECGPGEDERIRHAFVLALGRPPEEAERDAARRFLVTQPREYPGKPDAAALAWVDLCQMLLASNAFLTIE